MNVIIKINIIVNNPVKIQTIYPTIIIVLGDMQDRFSSLLQQNNKNILSWTSKYPRTLLVCMQAWQC